MLSATQQQLQPDTQRQSSQRFSTAYTCTATELTLPEVLTQLALPTLDEAHRITLTGALFRVSINTAVLKAFVDFARSGPAGRLLLEQLLGHSVRLGVGRDTQYNVLGTLVWFTRVYDTEACSDWDGLAREARSVLCGPVRAVEGQLQHLQHYSPFFETRPLAWALLAHVLDGAATDVVPMDSYAKDSFPRVLRLEQRTCGHCGRGAGEGGELCPVCFGVCYCGMLCRTQHWHTHKTLGCLRPASRHFVSQRDLYNARPRELAPMPYALFMQQFELLPPQLAA